MANIFFIQLIGVLATGLGTISLTASDYLHGKSLSHDEEIRMNKLGKGVHRMPFNLETIVSAALFLGGMGILTLNGISNTSEFISKI